MIESARELLGNSDAIVQLRALTPKIARSDAPALITGSTGTGKEHFARMLHELGKELPRHVCFKQPIAVLREHRWNPHRLVHAETDEPAVEQVVVELLHQLPLRADGIERLQQKRP